MAQFDVHRNPGSNHRSTPYVVVVQSAIFDEHPRRVVVPLMKVSAVSVAVRSPATPFFTIDGHELVLLPFDLATVPTRSLGKPVASLAREGDRIVAAIAQLVTRAYG